MKILLAAPYFFEPHRWNVMAYKTATSLARIGHDVVVFTSGSKGQAPVETPAPRLKIYRFRDFFIPDPANYGVLPFLSLRLARVVRRERPTHFLVFTHMFYNSLAAVWLKLFGKRVVVVIDTFPGIDWFGASPLVNKVLWLYARTVGMLPLRAAERVVLLHDGLVPTAKRLRLPYVVHPYGVEMHRYRNPPPLELEKKAGEVWVTYVGRFESVKNYRLILDAADDITSRFPHVSFLFVGDVSTKRELVERHRRERVRFLGHREDIPSILASSDIFVLASFSEGLPSALMEAMASGCACVATSVGGIPFVDAKAEGGALALVPPGDRDAFVHAIEELVDDAELRAALGRRARDVIEEHYQMDDLARGMVEILESA